MPMIVSLNPKTNAREKWLLRDANRPHVNASPHKTVIAVGVRFGESPWRAERGFGSRTVAFCAGAQGYETQLRRPDNCFRIFFDGNNFLDDDGKVVPECHMLYFMQDGSMFGAVAEASAETAEKAAA